jgi:signal transduction histidine kinase
MWKSVVAPALVVSALWIAVSIFSNYGVSLLVESNNRTLSDDVTTIESAWAMRRDIWRLQTAVLEATQPDSPPVLADIDHLELSFRDSLQDARRTSLTPPEMSLVDTIDGRFADYSNHLHRVLAGKTPGTPEIPSTDRATTAALAASVADACRALSETNDHLIKNASAKNRQLFVFLTILRYCSMVIGPALGLALGLWLSHRMRRTVSRISARLNGTGRVMHESIPQNSAPTDELPALGRQADLVAARVEKIVGELEKTRQQVIQSERLAAVGELAASLAHEIRNPLTSVKLLIQSATHQHQSRALNEKQSEIVLQEISRMESLIQNLLDFARPTRMRIIRHDVRQTLRRSLNLVHGRASQHSVNIIEDLPDVEVSLSGDPEQLLLVFLNLAINGIESMTGGQLKVSLRRDEDSCRITFRDTGPGIAPEVFGRLYEPFVTTKERGTGLGLAICQRVVREHKGTLSAENLPAGGASFTVHLPLGSPPVIAVQVPPDARGACFFAGGQTPEIAARHDQLGVN